MQSEKRINVLVYLLFLQLVVILPKLQYCFLLHVKRFA